MFDTVRQQFPAVGRQLEGLRWQISITVELRGDDLR